jgi:hypothetical protein
LGVEGKGKGGFAITFGGLKTHLAKNDSAAFFGREKQQVEKDL